MEIVIVVRNIRDDSILLSVSRTIAGSEDLAECYSEAIDELKHRGTEPDILLEDYIITFMKPEECFGQ